MPYSRALQGLTRYTLLRCNLPEWGGQKVLATAEYHECYKSSRGRSLLHRPLTEPTDSSVESLYPGDTAAFDTLAAPTMCKIRNVMPPVMGAKAW